MARNQSETNLARQRLIAYGKLNYEILKQIRAGTHFASMDGPLMGQALAAWRALYPRQQKELKGMLRADIHHYITMNYRWDPDGT